MTRTPIVVAASLALFGASAAASYQAAPHWGAMASPAMRQAKRHNLFFLVHSLTRSNLALQGQAQQVLKNLQAAQQKLGGLTAANRQLSHEVAENNAALSAMTTAIGINQALVQSQQQIIARESQTHLENAAVASSIVQLGGQVGGVENSMMNLYHVSEGLSNNMLGLSTTLTGVLAALQSLQANTTLPLVHIPATSLLPPLFGTSSPSTPTPSGASSHSPSTAVRTILLPANTILGGL